MVNMSEEKITKKIMEWLSQNGWKIIAFDFPQSGTGKYLHPNKDIREKESKNAYAFIPDIVAIKGDEALFFENKNRFYKDDFIKLKDIKTKGNYSESIADLLKDYNIKNIFYGVGLFNNVKDLEKARIYSSFVDFIILVDNFIVIEKGKIIFFK
jgi:hypothetical protein